jgi:hypothetical protein
MSRKFKRQTVELEKPVARPSRIRRDPLPADNAITRNLDKIDWHSPEWERRVVIVGILIFGLALFFIMIGSSEVTSH